MAKPLPTTEELLKIIPAVVHNARDLLSDAELLLSGGRYARALAVATLAREEFGKAHLCMVALPQGQDFAEEFWTMWRTHPAKLVEAGSAKLASLPPSGMDAMAFLRETFDASHQDNQRKMASLYVDFKAGKIRSPREVTPEAAQEAVAAAQMLSQITASLLADEMAPELTAWLGDPERLTRLEANARSLASKDPDAALQAAALLMRVGSGVGATDEDRVRALALLGIDPETLDFADGQPGADVIDP